MPSLPSVVSNRISCSEIRIFAYLGIILLVFVTPIVNYKNQSYSFDDESSESGSGALNNVIEERNKTPSLMWTCKPEPFGNDSESSSVYWNEAAVGQIAITNKPCLQPNGLPLTRRCTYSYAMNQSLIPSWMPVPENHTECITRTREKLVTNAMVDLEYEAFVANRTLPADAAKQLKQILKTGDAKLIPTDVHFACRIVQQIIARARNPAICLDLLSAYNRLMGADRDILRAASIFNSTNELVANFEQCVDSTFSEASVAVIPPEDQVDGITFKELGVRAHLAENLSVLYIDPEVANVSGIALYSEASDRQAPGMFREAYGEFYYRFLYADEEMDDLLDEKGLEMATYVPYSLWKNLTRYLPSKKLLIVKVYSNDALFIEPHFNTNRKVFSKIASLTIPGVTGYFNGLLPIIFHNQNTNISQTHPATGCGYWNYESWVSDGMEILQHGPAQSNLIACGSHHMTQFAYLIGGDYRYNDFSENIVITKLHLRALNIITLVGCTLSILGLLGIFITSIMFASWRSKASTKVLLHLSTAIIFQMIVFCFVNTHDMTIYLMDNKAYAGCIAVGALLQYSVLVEFTWMLIIAFFQFQRYVQVFGSRPQHFILKSALVGWGVPIIPPAILIAADRGSYIPYYSKDSSMMCYPSGNGLNFGVILPIALIIATNLVIFVLVLWNIRHTMEVSSKRSERSKIIQQIRLMVMMFFLFGFSWIFGLLAAMDMGLAFSYLFCITATLQGFVLFVYFVILDPATRKLWCQLYYKKEDKATESESVRLGTSTI